ncbi:hypothetical protein K493DRAFT_318615 [Basidiobolus meristosporus CBS 931.73]|uniref:IMS import disulfide relay-system CHCH-CHCH-like Cx9C domain-containing protein n=1 Tax=Basidiobolus meristosporus CBS 931.73 TaxID=1314790 RepID=A0A1Y1XV17_9FUNG|nr:hypothetical protein K493DRAFT_318615 [Basidiobolus meristosporus CBS 931.73]|eukprot:ORX89525.1 hypothetical protein K493DRAFT_318615 [Basidiobolus meristosporus CBS 931.73]
MDQTLDEVVKHCAVQLELYQRCIERNPESWETDCRQQRQDLTKCSEDNVGALKEVRIKCAYAVKDYETCLTSNHDEPEKCIDPLRELYECTQKVHDVWSATHNTTEDQNKPE